MNRTAEVLKWIDRLENHAAPSVTVPHRLADPGECQPIARAPRPRCGVILELEPKSAPPSGAVIAGCDCPACSSKRVASSDTGHIDHTPGGSPDPYSDPAPAPKTPAVRLARVRVELSHCGVAHCELVAETGERRPGTVHLDAGREWRLDPDQRELVAPRDLLRLADAAARLAWKGASDADRAECVSRTLESFLTSLRADGVALDAIPASALERGALYGRAANARKGMELEAKRMEGWGEEDDDNYGAPPPAARLELTPDPGAARAHAIDILDALGLARLGRFFPAVYAACRAVQGVTITEDALARGVDPDTAQTQVRRSGKALHSARVYGPKSHRLALHLDDDVHRVYHGVRFDPNAGKWRGDGAARPDDAPVTVHPEGAPAPTGAPRWTLPGTLHPATARRLQLAANARAARAARRREQG